MKIVKISRDFWVFLIFVVVAVIFWFAQTFQQTMTITTDYDIRLVNVPNNLIFTSDVPSSVSVSLTGRGYSLFEHLWKNKRDTIAIDYSSLQHLNGKTVIDLTMWKRIFAEDIHNHIIVNSVNPSPLEIYTSTGEHRQVNVRFTGSVTSSKDFALCGIDIEPQMVDVYAPPMILDTVTTAFTERKVFSGVNDTTVVTMSLQPISGVKFVPDKVKVRLCVDLMTRKKISVPVEAINVPSGKKLITFPSAIDVEFGVSSTLYNSVNPSDFRLTVNYNQAANDVNALSLSLIKKPEGVNDIKLSADKVEYIVE